jgi:membrane associated rhomboid family serine protease
MSPLVREMKLGPFRMPRIIALLILATGIASILAAMGARSGAPWFAADTVLRGSEIWRGELWRLATWALLDLSVLGLVFACLTLYWFGSDLVRHWGDRRFLAFFFGIAAAAGALTALLGRLLWTALEGFPYAGGWVVADAIVVAWGLLFPGREIRLYGVIRLTGRHLVWVTVGLTVLYALFSGLAALVPHLTAELLVLAALGPLRRLPATLARRRQATLAERARKFDLNEWIEHDRRRR